MSERATGPSRNAPDLLSQLSDIIRLVTDGPGEEIRPEQRFVDDLRIDSLSMVEILEGCAQHFAVRIDDEDAKDFVRVGDLVDYLSARLALA